MYAPSRRWLGWLLVAVVIGAAGWHLSRRLWACHHRQEAEQARDHCDYEAAWQHWRRCLSVWSNDADTLLEAARAARQAGRYADAADLLRQADSSSAPAAFVGLEQMLLVAQQGRADAKAIQALEEIAQLQPLVRVRILEALALGYQENYLPNRAWDCVQQLLNIDPEHVSGLILRGNLHEQANALTEARGDYQRAVERTPAHVPARVRLAEVLFAVHEYEAAQEHFQAALARAPERWQARLGLARCLRRRNQLAEAERLLRELTETDADQSAVLLELGQLYLEKEAPDQAEIWLRRALAADSHDPEVCFALARALDLQNHSDDAASWRRQAQTIRDDADRLRVLFEKIVQEPQAVAPRVEAGRLCQRRGQPGEALRWLNGALAIDPHDRAVHRALADYYESEADAALAAEHRRHVQ
jgi:tetratricopeptide (TPR) repeat protein